MKKKSPPWQTKVIAYTGYLLSFLFLAQILYGFIVTPIFLMVQKNAENLQELSLQMGGDIFSTLISYGILSVILKLISDAIFQGKRWSLGLTLIISILIFASGLKNGNYLYALVSGLILVCVGSAINHPYYKIIR